MQNYFIIILVLIASVLPSNALAGGFLIYNHDAAASAMGLAYTAQVKNPSAVLYNPAAINQLEGTQVSWGGTLIYSNASFRNSDTGHKTDQDSHFFFLPTFYATKKLNDSWSVGVGLFSPYGLTSNWPNDWEGRYIATFAQLRSFLLNPVVSYQVTSKLSIAGGFSGIYSDVLTRKNINLGPFSDGKVRFKADAFGWDYNLALLYKITDKVKFGLAYRSTAHMNYDGDVKFHVPGFLEKLVPEGGASVNIDLPGFITTGLCYSPTERWTIEFDVYWMNWSVYDELALKYDKKVPALLKKSAAPIIRDYNDTFDYCFGLSYKATDTLTLRAGYLYDGSPVPEENQDPILYDSNKNIYTMGIGYKKDKWSIDITNYLCFYNDLNVHNNRDGFNGKFENFVNMISFSITFRH